MTPDSRLPLNAIYSDPTLGATIESAKFLATRVATVKTEFQFFRIAQTAHSYSQAWAIILLADRFLHYYKL
jgi:hypothetical protein